MVLKVVYWDLLQNALLCDICDTVITKSFSKTCALIGWKLNKLVFQHNLINRNTGNLRGNFQEENHLPGITLHECNQNWYLNEGNEKMNFTTFRSFKRRFNKRNRPNIFLCSHWVIETLGEVGKKREMALRRSNFVLMLPRNFSALQNIHAYVSKTLWSHGKMFSISWTQWL